MISDENILRFLYFLFFILFLFVQNTFWLFKIFLFCFGCPCSTPLYKKELILENLAFFLTPL